MKKCDNCFYCNLNPKRLSDDQQIHWLPDPVIGSDGNYKDFEDIYSTATTDADRPSLKEGCHPTENDKSHKDMLTAGNVHPFSYFIHQKMTN